MSAVVRVAYAYELNPLLDAARTIWGEAFKGPGDVEAFIRQVDDDALADDLEGVKMEDLLHLLHEFWSFAETRPGDRILVRVRPALTREGEPMMRDVLEIISRDRPFLVDSVMGEISAQGPDVLAMFHPIVNLQRDEDGLRVASGGQHLAESMIQVHIAPLDDAGRRELEAGVLDTLKDVRASVEDFNDMRAQMDEAIAHLEAATTNAPREEVEESLAFLRWLRDDHFAFLGARSYRFDLDEAGELISREPIILNESGRGVLRDPERYILRRAVEPAQLAPAVEAFLRAPTPVIVAKANMKSRVHRRVYMDFIGVKRYREDGQVVGETRFVGLFTAEAYDQMARKVPLIRRKVRRVLEKAGKTPGSHSAKKLQNIVENYPRDELFQTEEEDLYEISLGILHLFDRPRTKLFFRRDQFDRFASVLLFVPRDRYNAKLREQAGDILREAFNGRLSAFYPMFGDGALARVHFIIGLEPFNHPEPDLLELESRIARLARTWEDDLQSAARLSGNKPLRAAVNRYLEGYSAGYRERYEPAEALLDIARMESLTEASPIAARSFQVDADGEARLHVKLYSAAKPLSLSNVLPVLEDLGLHVGSESGYAVRRNTRAGVESVWVHEFDMRFEAGQMEAFEAVGPAFEEAVIAVLDGRAESDGFNRLILSIAVGWRDAAFLRACARYRQQSGLDPSQALQEEALAAHPKIAHSLLKLAQVRFDPALDLDLKGREAEADAIVQEVQGLLDEVSSLDHDRALRRILRLLQATLRTNFHQRDAQGRHKPWISLKIDSRALIDLPEPKPHREIFVWSPRVEGVHIRFGPVARGGLRWSDRREDFRTEVLGLVKAQQVKNAVIVPVGSKGGFYPKQLPKSGPREDWIAEGAEAYKTFIRGLLDITDNIKGEAVKRPAEVVCWDDEDPYLVVAADKGTATFSDTANAVATDEYDFWLSDAFASGGSAGYDHKKMGITARGGWVSVQRHFRERGKDIQTEPFTVAGVGDMSGDVFGNGMLLSKQIRLIAAFDHRDIFIDPDPSDPERLWEERKRLFDLGRSSWADYDAGLISKGGGVFSRSAKSIRLNDEIKALTGLEDDAVAPNELIRALLKLDVELLWFGGIGTYVKAGPEQNYEVGDKANDALRINAGELRCKVVGEGANLGMTQAARIEFDREGGRVNADFVDNSAGVDSSDHEVNIKILLNPMVREGALSLPDRNVLLEAMTDEVAHHVLEHNYDQTLALTLAKENAAADLDAHERMMQRLERAGQLDREVEGLPSAEGMRELKARGLGLTRPEIAVLISYAKITLFDELVASNVPDDPHFNEALLSYFPHQLKPYGEAMHGHRLKREIIATMLANDMVNLGGPTFVHRAMESTAADGAAVARAFEAGRAIFRYSDLTDRINALDNQAPTAVQHQLHEEIIRLLRRQTYWLARRARGFEQGQVETIDEIIDAYRPGVDQLKGFVSAIASEHDQAGMTQRLDAYVEAGAPEDLARDVAQLRPLTSSSDVIDLSVRRSWPLEATAQLYHAIGARFRFDELRGSGGRISSDLHWDRLAVRRLIEDLYASQLSISEAMIGFAGEAGGSHQSRVETPDRDWAEALVDAWQSAHAVDVDRADAALDELAASGGWTLSKVAIASTQLRELAQGLA
ncbi:MAG: NAD-glutamate dehydrogenase [Pseudomonadota bacterium]